MDFVAEPEKMGSIGSIEGYCKVISMLNHQPLSKEQEDKVYTGLQEISENLDAIIAMPVQFSHFFSHCLPIFLNYLQHGPKNFLTEHSGHQIRKTMLDIMFRFPFSEVRNNILKILPIMYQVIEFDNEENAATALRIATDYNKKLHPQRLVDEVRVNCILYNAKKLIGIFRRMTLNFLQNVNKILEPRQTIGVLNQNDIDIESILEDIFTATSITIENAQLSIMPRGLYSLKLMHEIPVTTIFLYQMYRGALDSEIFELVRMGMNIINLQTTAAQRAHPAFTVDNFSDFFFVQVKYLSLVCFLAKAFDDKIHGMINPEKLPQAIINLFANCPDETPSHRKDLIVSTRCLITTSYRNGFAPCIDKFLDDNVLIGQGWTTRESLRPMAYGVMYDLLHHIRDQLTKDQLKMALNAYSKNLYDESLSLMLHIMSCRLMLNLTDSYYKQCDKDDKYDEIRQVMLKIFELFTNKMRATVIYIIPSIHARVLASTTATPPPIISLESMIHTLAQPLPTDEQAKDPSKSDIRKRESISSESTELTASSSEGASDITSASAPTLATEDLRLKFNFPDFSHLYTHTEARMLVKQLLNGLKILAYKLKEYADKAETSHNNSIIAQAQQVQAAAAAAAQAAGNPTPPPNIAPYTIKTGFCRPRDLKILNRLFRKGLKVFELYTIPVASQNAAAAAAAAAANAANSVAGTGSEKGGKPGEKTGGGGAGAASAPGGPTAGSEKSVPGGPAASVSTYPPRTKEEKEMMDTFAQIFMSLSPQTLRSILSTNIEYFVNCIHENATIQLIANNFLSNRASSFIMSNILVEYLLTRMDVMGNNVDMSNLHLRLFKMVFGSVSMFPNDNELMLKPHLHKIVNNSMKMALTAKEPYNYFLLLRALFRSIGGGSHDLLYQEFLPMLPSLLQGLNSLQSGIHRQNMKDLFVELCLTIPVRLSSLLPYLPWLMDPLVSALNGTTNLISQGLRTLELCVDNLQPDFLYEHIQPIRTELMQSLWRTLRHPTETIATVSFRILGKLGGSNHKLMVEPQKLNWIDYRDPATIGSIVQHYALVKGEQASLGAAQALLSGVSPAHLPSHDAYSFVSIYFSESTINATHPNQFTVNHSTPIHLPIDKVIETAHRGLLKPGTDSFYRHQCWEVIRGFFVAHIQHLTPDDRQSLHKLFLNPTFTTSEFCAPIGTQPCTSLSPSMGQFYRFPDEKIRKVHELALTSLITAAAIKELYNLVVPFMIPLVRQYTLVAICQQAGPGSGLILYGASMRGTGTQGGASSGSGSAATSPQGKFHGMDPLVLVDAIVAVMGQEDKELCKPGQLVLRIICDTAISILGSKERASQLPLYEYILERVTSMCYERAWFSKYGGCVTIRYLLKQMSIKWLFAHQFVILKAMLFIMMDLTGDLSSGVIEMAKENLEMLLRICGGPLEPHQLARERDLHEAQRKSMADTIIELVRQLTSPNEVVRQEVMHLLHVLAKVSGKTVTEVMTPHKDWISEVVPPRKTKLTQHPANVQIGLLDGNHFCITLDPPLFTIDTAIPEHANFVNDIFFIAETPDASLQKHPCYKTLESLVPLRICALRILAACHHLPNSRVQIFNVLYKTIESNDAELQECAFQCMSRYRALKEVDHELIRQPLRGLLKNFSDYRSLNVTTINRLKYLARLFTTVFNDKFCDQLNSHLAKIIDMCQLSIRRHRHTDIKLKQMIVNHTQQQQQQNAQNNAQNAENNQQQPNANAQQQQQPSLTAQANSTYEQTSKMIHLDVSNHINLCVELINLFAEIADEQYIEHMLRFLIKCENVLDTYATGRFYKAVCGFFKRFPVAAMALLEKCMNDQTVFRFLQFAIGHDEGQVFRNVMYENPAKLIQVLKNQAIALGAIKQESGQDGSPLDMPTSVPSPAGSVSSVASGSTTGGGGTTSNSGPSASGSAVSTAYHRFQAIKLVSILVRHNKGWLATQPDLVHLLKSIWLSDAFHAEHYSSFTLDHTQWNEPKLLVKCLLSYFESARADIEIFFHLLRAFNARYHADFEFFRHYLSEVVIKQWDVEWKRSAFMKFVEIFREEATTVISTVKKEDSLTFGTALTYLWSQELKARILQFIVIPLFAYAFENGETEKFIGPIPSPTAPAQHAQPGQPKDEKLDLVSVFIFKLVMDDAAGHPPVSDAVRIYMLQLSCLIIEHASIYVKPDPGNKRHDVSNKVRRFMTFAWPCLALKHSQDPAYKYHGHLLLAHFITKLAIHKRIIRQVFLSLMKASTAEARPIVRCALDVMIVPMTQRLEDGTLVLTQVTRKVILEDGHTMMQMVNMMQVIIRNYRLFYDMRQVFIPHMLNGINRLGISPNGTVDNRKIALDLVEVIIRWEYQRRHEEHTKAIAAAATPPNSLGSHRRSGGGQWTPNPVLPVEKMEVDGSTETIIEIKTEGGTSSTTTTQVGSVTPKQERASGASTAPAHDINYREYAEPLINFLIRFATVVNDMSHNGGVFGAQLMTSGGTTQSPVQTPNPAINAEFLGRRALALIKLALQTDIWPQVEIKIPLIERALGLPKENQGNSTCNSVCMGLELLCIFLQTMKEEPVLKIFYGLQKAIAITCTCTNSKVVRMMNQLLTKLMAIFPPSCASSTISTKGAPVKVVQDQLEPLEQLYTEIHSIILNGFGAYDKAQCIPVATQLATNPNNVNAATGGGGATPAQQLQALIPEITNSLSQLFGTLMILKAACHNQPSYIDRLMTPFMHMLQKLVKEHLMLAKIQNTPTDINSTLSVELIVLSMDLVKNRLGAMTQELRRAFIANVFLMLIEKSPDVKVMKAILKIFDEWLRQPFSPQTQGGGGGGGPGGGNSRPSSGGGLTPVLRERASLLTRIAANIETRLPEDVELSTAFLDIIYYIYTDDTLKTSDLAAKLETSFMAGLRCSQPAMRAKFFSIMDNAIRKRLYDRLMYMICEQNWDNIGKHYWIKQCIELILSITNQGIPLSSPNQFSTLPLPTSFVSLPETLNYEKFFANSGGGPGAHAQDNFSGLSQDVLMDFDFISPAQPSHSHSQHTTGTSDHDAAHASSSNVEMVDQQSAAANSFLSDLFGSQSVSISSSQSGGGGGPGANAHAQLQSIMHTTPTRHRTNSSGPTGRALTSASAGTQPSGHKQTMLAIVADFITNFQGFKPPAFINAITQLCHMDSTLAEHLWIQLLPRIYAIMGDKQQLLISLQLGPFLVSGAHTHQKDMPISAVNTFFEAVSYCKPQITLRPSMMKYLGKNHNLWHRVAILLEGYLERADPTTPCSGLGGLLTNGSIGTATAAVTNQATPAQKNTRGSSNNSQNNHNSQQNQNQNQGAAQPTQTSAHDIFPAELSQAGVTYGQDCTSVLAQIYETLREEDYWAGIWQRHANYSETLIGIAYEQQGFFEQAKGAYELAMTKVGNDYGGTVPAPTTLKGEYNLWEQHWIRCSKELNQWDFLLEYGNSAEAKNPLLVMESAWRIPDWDQMNDAITVVEQNLPMDFVWKCALYKGYNAICNPKHRDIDSVQRMVDVAMNWITTHWRKLPPLISSVHLEYLHAAHQVIELQEAGLLHQSIFNGGNAANQASPSGHERGASPVDLRAVIKTWKNRLPVLSDDLSHWSDIFTWRQHHYQAVVSRFEGEAIRATNSQAANHCLLGAHASAQALIHYAKIARKHFLTGVALDSLNRIHTIPKVPIIDCFQKIRQQLKCYLLMHAIQPSGDELQEGLSVIESTHMKYFQREMISEFYSMKGNFLMKMGALEEANKCFSVSTQIVDVLVHAWSLWGEYYDDLFTKDPFKQRNMDYGVSAIIAFLHACRVSNEAKNRKHLSKVIYLQSYDDDQGTLAKTTDRYNAGVPPITWLPWIPQLLHCICKPEGLSLTNIVSQISKLYPQAVYFPLRTMYLTLKLEQREVKYKQSVWYQVNNMKQNQSQQQQQSSSSSSASNSNNSGGTPNQGTESGGGAPTTVHEQMLASNALLKTSRIMHNQREVCPTILTTLEGIIDQMVHFRENWYEEVLRQLCQVLQKCYASAFENRTSVKDTPISTNIFQYLRKLISTFGLGVENILHSSGGGVGLTTPTKGDSSTDGVHQMTVAQRVALQHARAAAGGGSEGLMSKRTQATMQDPVFKKMKQQFTADFDFSSPLLANNRKLHYLIAKLKKWIKILEDKTRLLPQSWLLEEKCRFLSTFASQNENIALPGDFLLPKVGNCVFIGRFMPRVEVVAKHSTTARRLYIRGQNGKVYPFLVVSDSSLADSRREERFLQLQRLLNLYLCKHKETARRNLNFSIPRVVSFAPQTRFVEDNVTSLSLLEIFKQYSLRKGSDPDAPIAKYYEQLMSVQTRLASTNQLAATTQPIPVSVYRDIVTDIQQSMAPKTLLKEWAMQTYNSAPDYWHFRKLLTLQLGLADFCEFAFHLNRLNPEMMYIHRDTGLTNIAYFRFELNEETGELANNQPVPFRLSYSLQNFLTQFGMQGPMTAGMIAAASCFTHPNYKIRSILQAIIRDEIITWYKRIKSSERLQLLHTIAQHMNIAKQAAANSSAAQQAAAQAQQDAHDAAVARRAQRQIVNQQDDEDEGDDENMDVSGSGGGGATSTSSEDNQRQLAKLLAAVEAMPTDIPEIDGEQLVGRVNKAVNSIMTRLSSLAVFEGSDSKVSALITAATNQDNLCRMDPAWHPWL